jgi:hypothetical protein
LVAHLPSLELKCEFQNQLYHLGQEINFNCRITTSRDVLITEGRIDLICEETWREFFTITVPISGGAPRLRGEAYMQPPTRIKRIAEKQREIFTHSSKIFLEMAELVGPTTHEFSSILSLETFEPLHATWGDICWKLVVTIVTSNDGHFRTSKEVLVDLGQK